MRFATSILARWLTESYRLYPIYPAGNRRPEATIV